jgi:hypothetical protein
VLFATCDEELGELRAEISVLPLVVVLQKEGEGVATDQIS